MCQLLSAYLILTIIKGIASSDEGFFFFFFFLLFSTLSALCNDLSYMTDAITPEITFAGILAITVLKCVANGKSPVLVRRSANSMTFEETKHKFLGKLHQTSICFFKGGSIFLKLLTSGYYCLLKCFSPSNNLAT